MKLFVDCCLQHRFEAVRSATLQEDSGVAILRSVDEREQSGADLVDDLDEFGVPGAHVDEASLFDRLGGEEWSWREKDLLLRVHGWKLFLKLALVVYI